MVEKIPERLMLPGESIRETREVLQEIISSDDGASVGVGLNRDRRDILIVNFRSRPDDSRLSELAQQIDGAGVSRDVIRFQVTGQGPQRPKPFSLPVPS